MAPGAVPPPPPDTSGMAKATAALATLQVIAESVVGYRAKLVEGGVGREAADQMAAKYNEMMLAVVGKQMGAGI